MAERVRHALFALVAAGLLASAVGVTRASFSANSSSAANRFSAGTVALTDNASGAAALTLSAAEPGASDTGCILVTYDGSLPSTVRLHATVSGGLAPHLQLTVTRGIESAPTFDACGGFTPDAMDYVGAGPGIVYSGTLAGYPTTYSAGIVDPPAGQVHQWTSGTTRSYRLAITLANNPAAAGQSSTATFRWEARNV